MSENDMDRRLDKTRRRRELIVEAAVDCFAEKGFHQSSMRDIAAHAGVSLGNLYNHFASKSDLIVEIARLEARDMKTLLTRMDGEGKPQGIILQMLEQLWDDCRDPLLGRLSLEIMAEASRNNEIYRLFEQNRQMRASILSEKIQQSLSTRGDQLLVAEALIDLVEAKALREAIEEPETPTATFETLKPLILKLIS